MNGCGYGCQRHRGNSYIEKSSTVLRAVATAGHIMAEVSKLGVDLSTDIAMRIFHEASSVRAVSITL